MNAGRRFELILELGTGAFGTVYLAEMVSQGSFRKRVALKVLNPQWEGASDAARRLRDEARVLGRLRHRNVVQVDDLVRLGGRWGVVMEHVPGADLERVAQALNTAGVAFPAAAALEMAAAVASALDAAWNGCVDESAPLRVIHRDIKPSNIRLTPEGDIKVLDFGIARAEFDEREAKTEQVRYGSVGYMAPERLLGEAEVIEGDVYALGCVLYEVLAGRALGRAELAPAKQERQVAEACALVLEQRGPSIAEAVELLSSMLRYEPDERPSPQALAVSLKKLFRAQTDNDLAAFGPEAIALVQRVLGDTTRKVEGVMSEETITLPAEGERRGPVTASPTILVPDADEFVEDPPEATDSQTAKTEGGTAPAVPQRVVLTHQAQRSSAGGAWMIGAAVALVVVILVGGAGLWMFRDSLTTTPTTLLDTTAEATSPPPPTDTTTAPPAPTDEATAEVPVEGANTSAEADAPSANDVIAAAAAAAAPTTTASSGSASAASKATATKPREATASAPAAAVAPAVATPSGTPSAATIRSVKFAVVDASQVSASCQGATASGATSALVRDLQPGRCAVAATVNGTAVKTNVDVDVGRGYTCTVEGGSLQCR
jgi:eukaryotic-like serine/threonine-protein kinase